MKTASSRHRSPRSRPFESLTIFMWWEPALRRTVRPEKTPRWVHNVIKDTYLAAAVATGAGVGVFLAGAALGFATATLKID